MKQKYCPYCDQKMTSGHYCEGCRRIVWHPYEQDVDYYLNERHPQDDAGCLYHSSGENHSAFVTEPGSGTNRKTQESSRGQSWEKAASGMMKKIGNQMKQADSRTEKAGTNGRIKTDNARRRGGSLSGIGVIFLIWFIIAMVRGLLLMVKSAFSMFWNFLII